MKWKILYEVKFRGAWELTVEAETQTEAVEKLKKMILDKIEVIRIDAIPIVSHEDFLEAMEKATEVFGQDPAYYGEEGEEEVFKQLLKLGYSEEDLNKSRGR